MVSDRTQNPDHHRGYVQAVTWELSPQVGAKVPFLVQLFGSSFNLEIVPGDCHLDEVQLSVSLILEKDVWMTGHNFLVRGDRNVPEDLCALVFTDQ